MALKRVKNIVGTTDPIRAYGGIRLSEAAAEQLAAQLRAGIAPMSINHNADRVVAATNVDAYTERRDDGQLNVWIEFDVPEEDWADIMEEIHKDGAPGGFSFTTFEPIAGDPEAAVWVAADAHHFSDSDIKAIATSFEGRYATRTDRVYQFSFVPDAAIFISFSTTVLAEVPGHVLASMIVDSCKSLVRPQRPNVFNFTVHKRGGRLSARVRIEVEDAAAFVAAVDKVPDTLKAALASNEPEGQPGLE